MHHWLQQLQSKENRCYVPAVLINASGPTQKRKDDCVTEHDSYISHTLFPFLFSFTDTHTHQFQLKEPVSLYVPRSHAKVPFFSFYSHAVEIKLPLNSVIKIKPQLIQPCTRSWPKHPHVLIPKGMYQDAIHRREHKHVITHTQTHTHVHKITALRRCHLTFVMYHAGQIQGRNKNWADFFFFF